MSRQTFFVSCTSPTENKRVVRRLIDPQRAFLPNDALYGDADLYDSDGELDWRRLRECAGGFDAAGRLVRAPLRPHLSVTRFEDIDPPAIAGPEPPAPP